MLVRARFSSGFGVAEPRRQSGEMLSFFRGAVSLDRGCAAPTVSAVNASASAAKQLCTGCLVALCNCDEC